MPVIKAFNCPSCGAAISNVKNSKGTCEYCGSTYYIEGLDNCLQTVKKENIKSGINFEPCAEIVHKNIVDFLTDNVCAPLDILDLTSISVKENLCVPAYYYHYNGTSDYLCDVGNENIKHLSGKEGSIQKVTETSWSTISGNIRAETQRIASGNKEYDFIIDDFYKPYKNGNLAYNENKLVDVDSLVIPPNVNSIPFNRPSSELLDKYVRSDMEAAFKRSVLRQIGNRDSRNISFGSSNIEKDGTIDRLLISICHIVFEYKGTTFSMYTSGDGKKFKFENESPVDNEREKELEEINKKYETISGKVSQYNIGIGVGIIIMLILFFAASFFGLIIVPFIIFFIYKSAPLRKERTKIKEEIDLFKNQIQKIKEDFLSSNKKLKNYDFLEI